MAQQGDADPFVSVIVPVRNEADFMERCLQSILDCAYPNDRMEVIVVDGMSDDGTRSIVDDFSSRDPRVRLIDNPKRTTPYAMNNGIRAAKGEIITRVDGHATVDREFLRASVDALKVHPESWCAGGAVETMNSTLVGRAIAGAMTSPVGVGNAMFRLGGYEGHVDTIAFGSYWRWVFDRIGMFDEELVRNQDDELNLRLILAGGKIFLTPNVRSQYFPRTSLRKLARQYYQYGFWRIRTIQKHRQPATIRQIAPLVFVLIWIALLIGAVFWRPALWGLALFAGTYILALLAGSLGVMRRCGFLPGALALIVFAILHFGYGIGSLVGIFAFVLLRGKTLRKPEEHAMSR